MCYNHCSHDHKFNHERRHPGHVYPINDEPDEWAKSNGAHNDSRSQKPGGIVTLQTHHYHQYGA